MLTDTHGRTFRYLRLSLTEVCNFRCSYCLPDGYACDHPRNEMSADEVLRVARAFVELGVEKIRLTGGEPTIRRDFTAIVAALKGLPGLNQLAATTNAYKLARRVDEWRAAGLDALNVSIDSLDPRLFHSITGHDKLHAVLEGVDKAIASGLKVKVNSVLLKGLNDHQLSDYLNYVRTRPVALRFIELMQTGDNEDYFRRHHLPGKDIQQWLLSRGWRLKPRAITDGPALEYTHPDYQGRIGLIMPYSSDFCRSCNRLRVSASGHLHLCLFASEGHGLRDLLQDDSQALQLRMRIQSLLHSKVAAHALHLGQTGATRQLAMLGG